MKVLIVYENIPEETNLYVIEDPTADELRMLRGAAGHYINSDDTPECHELSELLATDRAEKLDGDKPVEGPFDVVFVTGFVC